MSTKRGTLIVVVGPTGSGKSALAVKLAQHYNAPVISTDSRQVFRNMAIGTAQPTAEELAAA
ncbi:MAG: AAA family ATPase, partial [Alistipes sp.]|nr:AAA family ATPase [Alistipes sp.]